MSRKRKIFFFILCILLIGFLIPENMSIPVAGANRNSWNKESFWYYPWGRSGTHKGIDIFAKEGTDVISATAGIVLYKGEISMGGNVIVVLGPKWRIHYYAHLKTFSTHFLAFVSRGEKIAEVGTTGNAQGKPPHLHYSFATLIPYLWRIDGDHQGWKKMFYLNPAEHFNQ
ncbi:MAG: peptidoglycan DD-metalloendopeptidase family protein [Bacteroidia bacterium]